MASGPLDDAQPVPLDAESDALRARCEAAEQQVADLTAELDAARARIVDLETAAESPMDIFDSGPGAPAEGMAKDGSDPRVLALALAATAVVAGMVVLLMLLNGVLLTPFGIAMIVLTVGLAWAATRARVAVVDVTVTHGVVLITKGETHYRFDLNHEGTRVDMNGEPGDPSWQVLFHRKHMDDFVVDDSMVDLREFVRRLREVRPEL